jgi:hypothetical protein
MIRFYYYKHPETGEIFSDQRMEGFEEKPLIIKGVKHELVRDYVPPRKKQKDLAPVIINKNREVFEADPAFVKKCKPKYVKFQDGHKEKYDPTKHC